MIAVKRRLENGESFEAIGKSIGVHFQMIREWCRKYQSMGPDAFERTKNNKYTLEFKTAAVEYYLQGKGSLFNTCKEFLRTISTLQHDERNVEDMDTDGEDHIADEWRDACMSRPMPAPQPVPEEPLRWFRDPLKR